MKLSLEDYMAIGQELGVDSTKVAVAVNLAMRRIAGNRIAMLGLVGEILDAAGLGDKTVNLNEASKAAGKTLMEFVA